MLTVKVISILLLKYMFYQKLLGHYIFFDDGGPSTSSQMVEEIKLIPALVLGEASKLNGLVITKNKYIKCSFLQKRDSRKMKTDSLLLLLPCSIIPIHWSRYEINSSILPSENKKKNTCAWAKWKTKWVNRVNNSVVTISGKAHSVLFTASQFTYVIWFTYI